MVMENQEKIAFVETVATSRTDNNPIEARQVLLVEDDWALRRYLEVVLVRAGYSVMSAADGLAAMKITLTAPIDIVVTDAMMPKVSGYELCKFIRSHDQLNHLPIVLLSALGRKEAEGETIQADAFLSKPVSAEDLTECLEELLMRRQS
jgi:CheY-like chemotaxis protein